MSINLKSIILAQLGDPPPPTRAERQVVYDRIRDGFEAMNSTAAASDEHVLEALALQQTIASIEAELERSAEAQPVAEGEPVAEPEPVAEAEPPPHEPAPARTARTRMVAAVVAVVVALLAAGTAYLVLVQRQPTPTATVVLQKEADTNLAREADVAATDKARTFQGAMRDGDVATVAFLLQSGYQPTRVELRNALLEVKYTQQIQSATAALAPDIRDIACGFASFYEVRKPMAAPRLFDAEDAFAIMKQIGQESWRSTCLNEAARWREALAKIEQQYAQYSKPDAEKKQQAQACIQRFSARDAGERWEQANCQACPESHSNCEAFCPNAAKAADAEEARFFRFNRSDVAMAATLARRTNVTRAELYCNLQYLTRVTDFDLANLQRFRTLVSLFDPQ